MQYFNFYILLFILANPIYAQTDFVHEKRNYVWLTGSQGISSDPLFQGAKIDFNQFPPMVSEELRDVTLEVNITFMCDVEGQLLFYSDEHQVVNADHEILSNGTGLNPLSIENNALQWQGSLSIPFPGQPNDYILFHKDFNTIELNGEWTFGVDKLYYSTINFASDAGEVLEKNVIIVQDTLEVGKITACRHANGQDWWLIGRRHNTNSYYRIYLSANGVELLPDQVIGDTARSSIGRAVFSPDGSKFSISSSTNPVYGSWIELYDFDRCTGQLSNHQKLFHAIPPILLHSVAFSPNSRWLYANSTRKIWQYDTWAADVAVTGDTIARYDWDIPVEETTLFRHMVLAPDDKIYIDGVGGCYHYHIINDPDEQGVMCNFEQNGLELPTYNYRTISNHVDYKLGPVDGSPCDTLGIDNVMVSTENLLEEQSSFSIYPNPTSGFFTLECNEVVELNTTLALIDAIGRVVVSQALTSIQFNHTIDISDLPQGVYFYKIEKDGVLMGAGKVVKD